MNHDVDLGDEAGAMLAKMPVYSLSAKSNITNEKATITVQTKNLTRVDVLLDQRPKLSLDVKDGDTTFEISRLPSESGNRVELLGYKDAELAAAIRLSL